MGRGGYYCSSVAFWQQRAVSPLRLGFASADVGWVIWVAVVITQGIFENEETNSRTG